jgi:hypothetical protein
MNSVIGLFRSFLKIRIFVRNQGETKTQPAGILKYVEDLRRGLNTDIGRKGFFEMASNIRYHNRSTLANRYPHRCPVPIEIPVVLDVALLVS